MEQVQGQEATSFSARTILLPLIRTVVLMCVLGRLVCTSESPGSFLKMLCTVLGPSSRIHVQLTPQRPRKGLCAFLISPKPPKLDHL